MIKAAFCLVLLVAPAFLEGLPFQETPSADGSLPGHEVEFTKSKGTKLSNETGEAPVLRISTGEKPNYSDSQLAWGNEKEEGEGDKKNEKTDEYEGEITEHDSDDNSKIGLVLNTNGALSPHMSTAFPPPLNPLCEWTHEIDYNPSTRLPVRLYKAVCNSKCRACPKGYSSQPYFNDVFVLRRTETWIDDDTVTYGKWYTSSQVLAVSCVCSQTH